MKKNVKRMLLTISGILLLTMSTAGAEYINSTSYNFDTKKVEVKGNGFEEYAGGYATVLVVDGDGTAEYATENVEKQDMVKIGDDGKFFMEFELSTATSKTYTAYVKAGSLDIKTTTFKSMNALQTTVLKNNVLTSSPATLSDATLSANIKNKSADLQLNATVYGSLAADGDSREKVASFITDDEMDAITTALSANENGKALELLRDSVERASYILALNEGLGEDVVYSDGTFNDAELLGLEDLEADGVTAYTLFMTAISDTGREYVLGSLKNQNFKSVDEFLDYFTYYTTVAAIRYSTVSGKGNIETVLKGNEARLENLGITLDVYKDSQDNKNYINDLLSSSDQKWDLDSFKETLETEAPSEGGGGGGSSNGNTLKPAGSYSGNYTAGGTTSTETTVTFTDLDDVEWARPSIEGLAEAGVVSGRGNGIYAPLDSVTRAEFLQMLVKALGIEVENATCEFLDVEAGAWYYNAVATGTTFGLASGYGNGYFGTTDLITRQDAAVMLNNAVVKSGKNLVELNDGIDFADKAEIADYAADDVEVLVKAGILNGTNGSFLPKNNTTRAEAAVMISQIINALGLEG